MAQRFQASKAARTITEGDVYRMGDDEVWAHCKLHRWPDTDGEPVCPHCGVLRCYEIRTRKIFKCSGCRKQFSLTSGTVLHSRKKPLRYYLIIALKFAMNVKGCAATVLGRTVGSEEKAAWVLSHKLREAVRNNRANLMLGTTGVVELDGGYFGGHIRPKNTGREGLKPTIKRRKACVLVLRERAGATLTKVIETENSQDIDAIVRKHVLKGAELAADESAAYNVLHARHKVYRINHRLMYSDKMGGHTNNAESFFSRLRRSQWGIHHRFSRRYLAFYAAEMAYHQDRCKIDFRTIFNEISEFLLGMPMSRRFKGYWQHGPLETDA